MLFVTASSPAFISRPIARPILAWKMHCDAPESMIASNRFERGEFFAGKAIFTATVAA
jgi:hypothetical protein